MKKILIIGAGSAIAEAVARLFAQRGDYLFLVGRKAEVLNSLCADLNVRGAGAIGMHVMDANDFSAHEAMLNDAERSLGGLDVVLIAHGTLSDQKACEASVDLTLREMTTNALSVVALLTRVAERFEQRKTGRWSAAAAPTIAVISSVAGERGRQSNYVYGSAKAMVTAFTSGMRQRLSKSGVRVVTIKPGFVDTPMTAALEKGLLWARPQQIAPAIVRAVDGASGVLYVPGFWRLIMFVIRCIPERVFQRLKL
jgi:decaprenylphospho-beta-D-erythro-pentofuranosid-2-ulose 2-reductase